MTLIVRNHNHEATTNMTTRTLPLTLDPPPRREDEWEAVMRYADLHEAEIEPGAICTCQNVIRCCNSQHDGYFCSRGADHDGPHAACGGNEHNLATWPNPDAASTPPEPPACCDAMHYSGCLCTLELGHPGLHKAYGIPGQPPSAIWRDSDSRNF